MNKIFLAIFFSVNLFGYSYSDILNSIRYVAATQGVEPRILYTIVKIESDFDPFAISFLTNSQNATYFKSLENDNIRIKISQYSLNRSKWVVSISPVNEAYATQIARLLIQDGFSIDVGLGQLNSQNFELSEVDEIFNPVQNLTKCSKILRGCFNAKNKDIKNTIECYNYGMRKRHSNPYFNRFFKHYESRFGSPYKE